MRMFRVNLESITFLKVRKIMYLDKAYIIVKRNVLSFIKKQTEIQIYKYTNNMQVMRLMLKGEYLIIPKGTKFTGSGKLGLNMRQTKCLFSLNTWFVARGETRGWRRELDLPNYPDPPFRIL